MASIDEIYHGAAIFSTQLGRFEPRNNLPPSIILRSSPNDDQDEMVARLQSTFPEQCKLITAPITDIPYYFDAYDMHLHGYRFLESVLATIARHNFNRASKVQSFAEEWICANPRGFEGILSMTYAVFAETADHTHGEDFLKEVFCLLKGIKTYRSAATELRTDQSASAPQKSLACHPGTAILRSPNDQSSAPAPTSGRRYGDPSGRTISLLNPPTYPTRTYQATPPSSSSHVALQSGPNPSKSQKSTLSSQNNTHEPSPHSSSSHATFQPGPNPRKPRMNTRSSQGRANGISPESTSSNGAPQPGSNPRKSRGNTPTSQSHANGISPESSSSNAALQPGSNPRKSGVNNGSSGSRTNGTSHNHTNGSSQRHANGASHNRTNGASHNRTNGASHNRTNGASQNRTNGASHNHTNGASQRHARGASQRHARGASQSHARGASQSQALGAFQNFSYATSQSHQYGVSQAFEQGIYQQHPSGYVVSQLDLFRMQPVNQGARYESLRLPGRALFPARRDFHSDPEFYTRHLQNQLAGPIIAYSSPAPSGPFSYHYLPPNIHSIPWPPMQQDPVTIPNPVKTVSDDARVLEMQEAASRKILNEFNNPEVSICQPSAKAFGKLPDPELYSSAPPSSSSHVSNEQPASNLLDKDPAVISVGWKPDRELNQIDHHPADVHQNPQHEKGGFLTSLIQKHQPLVQQPSTPIVSEMKNNDSLAGSHNVNAHKTDQKSDKVKTPPDAREPPTCGIQSESKEIRGHEQEPLIRNMTSDVQDHAITRSNSFHGNSKFSNTAPSSFQGKQYRSRPDPSHSHDKDTVWVGGLYPELCKTKVRELFEPYGEIRRVSKIFTRDGETRKAFAFVTFLTEEAAARAIDGLNYRNYEDMALRVRYAWQIKKYGDAIHRISPACVLNDDSSDQHDAISLDGYISSHSESKGRDVTSRSLGRKDGDPPKTYLSKVKCLSKPKWQSDKTIETPNNVSGSSSRQHHETSFSSAQNRNVAADSGEVSESIKGTATVELDRKPAQSFSGLHDSLQIPPTTEDELGITKDISKVDESLQELSIVEEGVKIAQDSPKMSEGLETSSKLEQKVVPDVPKQQKSTEPMEDTEALADAPALNSSDMDHSQTSPQKMSETGIVPAAEPQVNQDTKASVPSLASVDNSDLLLLSGTKDSNRLSHKVRWKLQQRAVKAAKQKMNLENEQKKSGAKGVGCLAETSGESIALDVKSEGTDSSVSEKILTDIAQQQTKVETDSQRSSDENSRSGSVGQTESSIGTQNQVPLASQTVGAPETLSTTVNETLSADWPSLPNRVEVDGTEASPLSQTPATSQKKKKKKKRKNATMVETNAETVSKSEPNPSIIKNSTNFEILLDHIDEECATRGIGSPDGTSETLIDDEVLERTCEPVDPLRTESVTPTQDHPVSKASGPKNTKNRKARKSKGKGKAKSAGGSSQTPAFPSGEPAEASAVPSEKLAKAAAFVVRFFPEAEAPVLTDKTHDVPAIEIDEKEKGQTHTVPPIDGDEKENGQTNILPSLKIDEKGKGGKKSKSKSTAEEPHVCSRRELTRYHRLKENNYWSVLSKIIQRPTVPDPSSSMKPMPEKPQDVEIGEPCVAHSQPMESGEANSSAPTNRSGEANAAVDNVNRISPGAVVQAERPVQTFGDLAIPGSSTVAKSQLSSFESAPHHDSSTTGATEFSLPDPKVAVGHSNLPPGLSLICQPEAADIGSPPKPVLALSKTPPETPQTPYTRTRTGSSCSLGILSSDESSESSNVQSEDDLAENDGEEHAASKAKDGPPSPSGIPSFAVYPFHPSVGPSPSAPILQSSEPSSLQFGDFLEVASGLDGEERLVKVLRDIEAREASNLKLDENERDHVERQDAHAVRLEEPWGNSKKVWIG